MTRRRLPIGIQIFRRIREDGCYYVDKTAHIRRVVDEAGHDAPPEDGPRPPVRVV